MKKLTAFIAVVLCVTITPAYSVESPKSIVIIDTGYDPLVPQFKDKIVYEKCLSSSASSCPNGTYSQEGPGSAALNPSQLAITNANHGSKMLATSIWANPNAPIVYIRSSSFYKTTMYPMVDTDLNNLLLWVLANKDKLNVGSVAVSASRQITSCPSSTMNNTALSLKNAGIPVITASGNNYDYKNPAFPACLSNFISVGGTDDYGIALYSNVSKDFYARGTITLNIWGKDEKVVGTSAAAQVVAANWVAIKTLKPTLSYDQLYALMKTTANPVKNKYISGLAVDVAKASM